MTDYVKQVTAATEEYTKKRKKHADEAVAQINRAAAEKAAEAAAQTDTAVQAEQRAALDTVDAAAVQRMITLSQAKERLAALGLADSGVMNATVHAAGVRESRAAVSANKKRDAAVAALTEELSRTEAAIERSRAEGVLKETQTATEDAASYEAGLLKAAFSAQARENEATISAASKEKQEQIKAEAATLKAQLEAETTAKELAYKQQKLSTDTDEKQRITALNKLYNDRRITSEIYAQAVEGGWDVNTTLTNMAKVEVLRRQSAKAQQLYHDEGFDAMMRYLAPLNFTDGQVDALCHDLDISRKRVDEWMKGYRVFMASVPQGDWTEYYERKGTNEYTVY